MPQTKAGREKVTAKWAGLSVEEYREKIKSGEKRCTRCKTWKRPSEFGKDRTRPDGIDRSCFSCRRVKVKKCTKGRTSTFKGRKHTPEAKFKIGQAHKGNTYRLGIKHTEEVKALISAIARKQYPRGQSHYAWKNGSSERNKNDRRRPEYTDWRNAVFTRDNFTCQKCGDATGGNLRAHHIKSFADYPNLRYAITNGTTLCHPCHELEHYKPESIRNIRKLKRGEKLWR
jgi:5-methylcytosine-specific restriction endonuclease McrA